MKAGLAAGVGLAMAALAAAQTRPPSMAGRSTVYAPHAAIATSQPLASAAGLAVLENGGNAVDAAVTAAIVLTVVEPHMVGLGGDMFAMIWWAKDADLYGLNASGRAGALMTRDAILAKGHDRMPELGPEAITVPGSLSGWVALLERFGTISLAEAMAPAIRLADEGYPVSPIIARVWADETEVLKRDPGARATFLLDGERAPAAGDWFRNPDYANTLRRIAAEGPSLLYGGELGRRVAEYVQSLGGYLTPEDFAKHAVSWVEPVSVPWHGGIRLWELPPNGQGMAALEMLRILEPYDLKAMGHNSAAYLHHLIEAKKLAYADIERYVGDPDAMTVTPEQLLSDAYIAKRRAALDEWHAASRVEPGAPSTASETIYLTVADEQGNMISFINSNYDYFGSGIVVPGTGFPLQNRGAGFTLEPDRANTVAPGKRPFHTIIPAFVTKTRDTTGVKRSAAGEEPYILVRRDGRLDAAAGPRPGPAQPA